MLLGPRTVAPRMWALQVRRIKKGFNPESYVLYRRNRQRQERQILRRSILSPTSLFLSILDRPNKILFSNAREMGPQSTRSRRMDKICQPILSPSQCPDTPPPPLG